MIFIHWRGLVLLFSLVVFSPDWGFYGHRKINQLAVFLLPEEIIDFYKNNSYYLSRNATNPDSRRYAVPGEGPKHYFDTEEYFLDDIDTVPPTLQEALSRYNYWAVDGSPVDLVPIYNGLVIKINGHVDTLMIHEVERYYFREILPQHQADFASFTIVDSTSEDKYQNLEITVIDSLSDKGINPYHLNWMRKRLTSAFKNRDLETILRLSAEIGHYISDNCVPLHNTVNYNGQKTGQVGIHAFWESRIPELMAEKEWDFYFDDPLYIDHYEVYFMSLCENSFQDVPLVLAAEKEAKMSLDEDELWCYEERNNLVIRTQCEEFARRYNERMKDLVEKQFRQSIHSVASVWYSCWVDAGKPNLNQAEIVMKEEIIKTDPTVRENARKHEN